MADMRDIDRIEACIDKIQDKLRELEVEMSAQKQITIANEKAISKIQSTQLGVVGSIIAYLISAVLNSIGIMK
jgi:hypothetical protein